MDVEAYIARMEQLLAESRPVPLSASVMVNRSQFDELLVDLRNHLPEELRQSRWIIKERDELLEQAERDSERIMADAQIHRDRLISETEVARGAARQAERVVDEAREQARVLRLEAEDYVDGRLANFEIVLAKTMKAVENGRERLRGRLASDELAVTDDGLDEAQGTAANGSRRLYDHEG